MSEKRMEAGGLAVWASAWPAAWRMSAACSALALAACGGGGSGGGTQPVADVIAQPAAAAVVSTAEGTDGTSSMVAGVVAGVVAEAGTDTAQALGKKSGGSSGSSGSAPLIAQPANTEGRLLASNCFQCHGTLGTGGFDSIRGKEAREVLEFMNKPAGGSIMAAHAQGYTPAQLQKNHHLSAAVKPGATTMTTTNTNTVLTRRQLTALAAGSLATALMPLTGRADDDSKNSGGSSSSSSGSTTSSFGSSYALANTGLTGKRVVVVGGGMAGMTAAKYLRLWGGAGVQVTLVEPDAVYTSSIMSNLVLNGSRTVASLQYSRDALGTRYGVLRKTGSVAAVNAAAHTVTLDDGTVLAYDRLVLAPGISFDDAYGLTQADYDARTPHAWRAGAQTTLLRNQLAAMVNGDTFVMTIPKAPYRCPPGPYERACLVADYLKTAKGANCRVVILDENPSIQAEKHSFELAFGQIHAGVIQYVPGVSNIQVQAGTRLVSYTDVLGAPQHVQARVVNPIVPHRAAGSAAGGWMAQAGLNNGTAGRWANVDVRSYQSTAPGAADIHVIGDAASCGMPKAGHVANQEAKICADAIVRLLGGAAPDPQPVANSACYSPITASTASWLTVVYQYDAADGRMKPAASGGQMVIAGVAASATESSTIDRQNFKDMGTWFSTLMKDSTA